MKSIISRLKGWARTIKLDVYAIWIAARDKRIPWFVKLLAMMVAAYAISPIDLIPDFIPVIGYLDDIIIVPLGILLVVRLIPLELMQEFRSQAATATSRPTSQITAIIFVSIWILSFSLLAYILYQHYSAV